MTAHLIGFGEEQWASVRSWSERLMRIDGSSTTKTVMMDMGGAIMEFGGLGPLVEERRAPGTICGDLGERAARRLPGRESVMVQETGLFISGGAETTRTVIAVGCRAQRHPDQWDAIAADPTLIPTRSKSSSAG